MIVDSEENFRQEEIDKLERDVKEEGLSVLILAEWWVFARILLHLGFSCTAQNQYSLAHAQFVHLRMAEPTTVPTKSMFIAIVHASVRAPLPLHVSSPSRVFSAGTTRK